MLCCLLWRRASERRLTTVVLTAPASLVTALCSLSLRLPVTPHRVRLLHYHFTLLQLNSTQQDTTDAGVGHINARFAFITIITPLVIRYSLFTK